MGDERILKNMIGGEGGMVLEEAKRWLKDSKEELMRARETDDKHFYRRNAEDAFHAIVEAVDELLMYLGKSTPLNHGERFSLIDEVETENRKVAEKRIKARMGKALDILNVKCYYRGECDPDEIEERIKRAEELLRDIEKMLS